jgi:ATP citrate (pro-S)-lyase
MKAADLGSRKKTLFTSTISVERDGETFLLGVPVADFAREGCMGYLVGSLFLGRRLKSPQTAAFIELVLKATIDHGPYVSGAINTIVTTRAGKDMVSSLCAGLLTIGPRFGGATNESARIWHTYADSTPAAALVEMLAKQKKKISGIGHRKYRVDMPDPRVTLFEESLSFLKTKKYLTYAKNVEAITVRKNANLILNVDGIIAAGMLDILVEEEELSLDELGNLIDAEFFNAFFVFSRSAGLIAHFLDQRRLNEELVRLPEDAVFTPK